LNSSKVMYIGIGFCCLERVNYQPAGYVRNKIIKASVLGMFQFGISFLQCYLRSLQ